MPLRLFGEDTRRKLEPPLASIKRHRKSFGMHHGCFASGPLLRTNQILCHGMSSMTRILDADPRSPERSSRNRCPYLLIQRLGRFPSQTPGKPPKLFPGLGVPVRRLQSIAPDVVGRFNRVIVVPVSTEITRAMGIIFQVRKSILSNRSTLSSPKSGHPS